MPEETTAVNWVPMELSEPKPSRSEELAAMLTRLEREAAAAFAARTSVQSGSPTSGATSGHHMAGTEVVKSSTIEEVHCDVTITVTTAGGIKHVYTASADGGPMDSAGTLLGALGVLSRSP